ncbi:hypothetical protein [Flavobacterium sp. '19STA2R22 D10 B1']|uniref:hypothetical protein n=1 Tax=Flavobacterium aerium TaxID=3037261 RepID=UPI00278C359B|nr:hypothetical protein [Flavobacterium sp. '19STA2R22 D10 B1']
MTLIDFQDRIEKLNDDFMLYTSKKYLPTAEMIATYEKDKNLTFSDDVKEFLLTYGNLILEVNDDIWPKPQEGDVLDSWKFGYGFFVYGLTTNDETPSWMDFEEKYAEQEDDDAIEDGQLFFKRSGNLYKAYTNNGITTVDYGSFYDPDCEIFPGTIYDFLIAEIDKLEQDYIEYINQKTNS